jgi:outer membrane lipoprotein-sorting protein
LRALAIALALVTVSCGAPLMKLPSGPGASATDAADAQAQATGVCRGLRTLTAEVTATGRAAGSRFRGRLSVGVAAPASARIEAVAPFGPPVFIFVATGDDATLLLPRDDRILEHGRPEEVLNAVAGVPLSAADLHATLTGCAPAISAPQGHERGTDWRVVTDGGRAGGDELYLHRDRASQPWELVAVIHRRPASAAWRAEYHDHQNGVPRVIRLASIDSNRPADAGFDLTLRLTQVETNVPLEADVFRVEIPRSAQPITLDELRRARPGVRED